MKATLFGLGVATVAGKTYLKEKFGECTFAPSFGPKIRPSAATCWEGEGAHCSGAVLPRLRFARAAGVARSRVAAVHASRRLPGGARRARGFAGRRRVFSSPLFSPPVSTRVGPLLSPPPCRRRLGEAVGHELHVEGRGGARRVEGR